MIPKTIHYCWFGGSPKPEIIEKCIASWRKFCPDYEIIEWNESNYDVNKCDFIREAYDEKAWAFVSDYARIDLIAQHGGIYMDTDVELFGSLDNFLSFDGFFFWETARNIATGLGYGAIKGFNPLYAMLSYYNSTHFDRNKLSPCPAINTDAALGYCPELVRDGSKQIIRNVGFFDSAEYSKIARHYSTGLWFDGAKVILSNRQFKKRRIKSWLRSSSKFDWIEKHLGKRAVQMYTFLVYDFAEYGLVYYLKRRAKKSEK